MRFLIDTHIFLWFINGDTRLVLPARHLILDPQNEISLSIASLWEIAIKISSGKLQVQPNFVPFVPRQIEINDFKTLPIEFPHLIAVSQLPFHHRDPFDRLIAAQSLSENLTLISADAAFDAYGVTRRFQN